MEMTVEALTSMLEKARITSEHPLLQGHSFHVNAFSLSDGISINVIDDDTFDTIVTLFVPAHMKTTFRI